MKTLEDVGVHVGEMELLTVTTTIRLWSNAKFEAGTSISRLNDMSDHAASPRATRSKSRTKNTKPSEVIAAKCLPSSETWTTLTLVTELRRQMKREIYGEI